METNKNNRVTENEKYIIYEDENDYLSYRDLCKAIFAAMMLSLTTVITTNVPLSILSELTVWTIIISIIVIFNKLINKV